MLNKPHCVLKRRSGLNYDNSKKLRTNNSDEETLKILRNIHVMTPVRLSSGECLVSPGGGYASDGTPTIVVENHDRMAILLRNLEEKNKKECSEITKSYSPHSFFYKPEAYLLSTSSEEIIQSPNTLLLHDVKSLCFNTTPP